MTVRRTPDVDVDKDFEFIGNITKAYVDDQTGKRYIVGVASGVAVDRDGERVTRNAITGMARQVAKGGIKLTATHQQDWWSEIGDAIEAQHDPDTDELIIKNELPPEGVDALADKAWRTANTKRVGFSIGGKLLKSFYERDELGKKRKALDAIGLKHFALTQSPAYQHSFAEAVAKTWDGEPPADDEFTLDAEPDVKKDTTGSWAGGSSESGGGNTGRDSVGSGQRNAGQRKPGQKGMSTEDDGSGQEQEQLPQAKGGERHLACPNCGHEFAADLPLDPNERQSDDTQTDHDEDDDTDTGKTSAETPMSNLSDTLDSLRALAAAGDVTKTDDKPAPPAAEDVAKTAETDNVDVAKVVAAAYKAHEDRFAQLEEKLGEAFELVGKSVKALGDRLADLPQGRKSVARILPAPDGHQPEDGEKSVEKKIEEAPDALTALKAQNEALWGIK